MKNFYVQTIVLLFVVWTGFLLPIDMTLMAQNNIALTFTGRDQHNAYVQLHHVTIQNQTRDWTEEIYFPDTIFTILIAGIDNYTNDKKMQVIPNPFDGQTRVNLYSADNTSVKLMIVDIYGKICATYNGQLSSGNNYFDISLTLPQVYILSVQSHNGVQSVKMVNSGHAGKNRISYAGNVPHIAQVEIKGSKDHTFIIGDIMHFTGYYQQNNRLIPSSPVSQRLYGNENISLIFTGINDSLPCPGVASVTDIDGNNYNTVQIGNQCWMKENLRTTRYANGDSIPADNNVFAPRRIAPGNDENNVSAYGYLYNWYAVMHGESSSNSNPSGVQGICPTGWHVPSVSEWSQLVNYVKSKSPYLCDNNTNFIACALADHEGWTTWADCTPNLCPNGNNATGFSALPAGSSMNALGSSSLFFSSTVRQEEGYEEQGSTAYGYLLQLDLIQRDLGRDYLLSVRCVCDTFPNGYETFHTLPTVNTSLVSYITNNSAVCEGVVVDDGALNITMHGVCWSTSQNPTVEDNYTTEGSGMGYFFSIMTGLVPNTTYYVRTYATNDLGISYGDEVSFTTFDIPNPTQPVDGQPCLGAATLTDFDGNIYNTVQIGDQCWMKENLRTTHYPTGVSIKADMFQTTTTGSRYAPNNDIYKVNTYGYLYNWAAVMYNASSSSANPSGVTGICPYGWHVPSDAEFTQLTDYLESQSSYQCDLNNTFISKSLAFPLGWASSDETCAIGNNPIANNVTGFSLLPAGGCSNYNDYGSFGGHTYLWSATESSFTETAACSRTFIYHYATVEKTNHLKTGGMSVRCLRN